ncbi:hypothetical protein [Paenirhodobacter sp.]|uniref:hypothetical protein n=1 Tax=Paenirhodobacter sp. TaxID=1965326 RepID=UPI003B3D5113
MTQAVIILRAWAGLRNSVSFRNSSRKRRNQTYCSPKCQKNGARTPEKRGDRTGEADEDNRRRYERVRWLSYDLNRMPPDRQRAMILSLLEAASGEDATLRATLTDPQLLGALHPSAIGKLFWDAKDPSALNVAQMVNAFCRSEWGVGTEETILDNGKPAGRTFGELGANSGTPKEESLPPYVRRDLGEFLAALGVIRQANKSRAKGGADRTSAEDDLARCDAIVAQAQAAVNACQGVIPEQEPQKIGPVPEKAPP